ncbi:uncharacterized protein PAC_10226 [Phialocephala subalpina]|uniref:Clr5 domain-containing protein n=1 Tax=Phialocephala subalpina TaxID=576137 RepID=A0A1L7X5L7_9HELO|nr:uncharacterized protein PAC_10226 [Phialocephala subalpina]
MSQSIDSQRLNQIRFLAPNNTLEVVMRLMKERHGFTATKAQYEKLLEKCGSRKNHTSQDWEIVGQKVENRKRKGRESDVYLDGQLMPRKKLRKEISRHPVSTVQKLEQAQAPSPRTPPGFIVCTPSEQSTIHWMFNNLPILKFQQQSLSQFSETPALVDSHEPSLAQFLKKARGSRVFPIVESLLPNSALLDETAASGLAATSAEDLKRPVLFNLTVYLASNNFPGEANSETIYRWLKGHGTAHVLRGMVSMKGPTAEAVVEKLFRSAVEAEDVPIVKHFLDAGLNPNGHICRIRTISDTLTPMQFACITRNLALVRELIKAGSRTDQPGGGWKSSALVLAICGAYELYKSPGSRDLLSSTAIDSIKLNGRVYVGESEFPDQSRIENGLVSLLVDLIMALIAAGCDVNLQAQLGTDHSARFFLAEGHSPLTAAAKYRLKAVVDVLIKEGANVNLPSLGGYSALQECLYSSEQMFDDVKYTKTPKTMFERNDTYPGCFQASRLVDVIRSLLDAGSDPKYSALYRTDHCVDKTDSDSSFLYRSQFSVFDLAILSGTPEVIKLLLSAGVCVTEHSWSCAVATQCPKSLVYLCNAGFPASRKVIHAAIRKAQSNIAWWPTIKLLLRRHNDTETRKLIMFAAIKCGNLSMLEEIDTNGANDSIWLNGGTDLVTACEDCCRSCHIDMIRHVIDKALVYGLSLSQMLGGSIHAAVSSRSFNGSGRYMYQYDVYELVGTLLSAGADVNATSDKLEFETALLAAVRNRNVKLTKMLISANADVNIRSATNTTALILAIEAQNYVLVEMLLNAGADLNPELGCTKNHYNDCRYAPHKISGNPLVCAVGLSDPAIVNILIERGAKVNEHGQSKRFKGSGCRLPLTIALEMQDWPCVKCLLSKGAAVENPPEILMNTTPLTAALRYERRNESWVRLLLDSGAYPWHPLALRTAAEDTTMLQLLLAKIKTHWILPHGANFGRLALDIEIATNDVAMVEILLASDVVDVNAYPRCMADLYTTLPENSRGAIDITNAALKSNFDEFFWPRCGPPLQQAIRYSTPEMVRVLLDHGADPEAVSPHGGRGAPVQEATNSGNAKMFRPLQHKAKRDTITNNASHTALQIACRDGHKDVVDLLLEYGADVNAAPAKECGATALQYAAIRGYLGIAFALLENGANVNAPRAEDDGRTALEGAAEHGRIDMVRMLLNSGARVHGAGQEQYERALYIARRNGHLALSRMLEEYHG